MIVADASFLYALIDRRDRNHEPAAAWYTGATDELATTPMIVSEVDHLVRARGTSEGVRRLHEDLLEGAYGVSWREPLLGIAIVTAATYADLGVSLADGSLVALAAHLKTDRILTFDERHFRAMKPLRGGPGFTILPADA